MSWDEELPEDLDRAGVNWEVLDETSRRAVENAWREIYGRAFRGRPRLRHGTKAEHAYEQLQCDRYFIVPFAANVTGLPICVMKIRGLEGYECSGPLIPLGKFHMAEFFVAPTDFAWTMVHTHEDHGCGGPYFMMREWLLSD
jgi:hypothetical protein